MYVCMYSWVRLDWFEWMDWGSGEGRGGGVGMFGGGIGARGGYEGEQTIKEMDVQQYIVATHSIHTL